MALHNTEPGVFDQRLFTSTLQRLNLDARHDIVELLYAQSRKGMSEPNYVWIAWEWFGKKKVEKEPWIRRYALYKVIQWISDRRERILHHKLMDELDLKVNVYKWETDAAGNRIARYDDYDDWTHYTEREIDLLYREKMTEYESKRRRLKSYLF